MNSVLRPAVAMLAAMTLITGVAYPLVVTAIGQVVMPEQANGSLVRDGSGQVRGSALIAQAFDGDGWFQPRPSAGNFATVASGASNLGPTNPALAERVKAAAATLAGQGDGPVPLALLTTSGSGLDPDLPPEAALWQAKRVATARGLPLDTVQHLVAANTRSPLVGPPTVNVLALNQALLKLPGSVEP